MTTRNAIKKELEAPEVPDTHEERMALAFEYLHTRRPPLGNYTTKDCYEKAGVSRTAFYRKMKENNDPKIIPRRPSGKKGRNAILNETGKTILHETLTKDTLMLQAPATDKQFCNIVTDALRKQEGNESLTPELHNRYLQHLKKQFKKVASADVKAPHRLTAFLNIRNPLSLCAMLQSLYRKGLSSKQIYSSDDVSVLLNDNDKPSVITTKEAVEILGQMGIGTATTQTERKRRVITFNVTICSNGSEVCRVAKISDNNFNEYKSGPMVVRVKETERPFFLLLYHTSVSDEKVEEAMYESCIIPSVLDHQQRYQDSLLRPLEVLTSDSNAITQPIPESDTDVGELNDWVALFCDGAFGQIATLINKQLALINKNNYKIRLGKYAGGCSMTQSANDQGKMHSILKAQFQSPSFRYEDLKEDREGLQWQQLKKLFNPMDTSSFHSYWKCLQQAPEFLTKAFQPNTIISAYELTFKQLSSSEADQAIASINALADKVDEHGLVPEKDFETILDTAVDNSTPKTGKPLNDMALNRQRCVLLDTYTENRKRRLEEVTEENPRKKTKKRPIHCVCGKEMQDQDIFDGTIANSSTAEVWTKCGGSKCQIKFCSKPECRQMLMIHRGQCTKANNRPTTNTSKSTKSNNNSKKA